MSVKKLMIFAIAFSTVSVAMGQTYVERTDSADYYIKKEMWEDAERCIIEALRLEPANPTNAMLLTNLGTVQSNQGKHQEALQSFDIALSITPRSTVALTNRARTWLECGDTQHALDDLSEALAIDPNLLWPLKMRGMIYLAKGMPEAARDDFSRLNALQPDNADTLMGLAECETALGNIDGAIKLYSDAILNSPTDEFYCSRALLYLEKQDFSNAEADVAAALKMNPTNGNLFVVRGAIRMAQYRLNDALADRKLALGNGADPDFVDMLIPVKK